MRTETVNDAVFFEKLRRSLGGEHIVIDHDGTHYPARIQYVTGTGVKVIPESMLDGSQGEPGDLNGVMESFAYVVELEKDGVLYRRER
ncbi:hypothetical protein L861_03275 [Litchfieldella anticariensis FP35 = DSM 16096]|uniref:Uncharacterized protein n=1 Tax=Litchfieldella anticariensis (strain DSM 16096 / CECT 5854 / CIP 108499 / LMG 22089 / FP35) TaxID=1121939 RepID=S2KR38_LITA3|nr:hypothetical protein [Halomonas anticariensis]EPC04355.1 hypothetical protein L861_03275 [Halomonas anticariensis FP35 = DSM 16096]